MSRPKVSVIMSAYNGEGYIAESIGSVIDQTYRDWELIVVDDGSVDRTKEIVLQLREQESRIRYIHQSNAGQGNARNTGIRQSRGDSIAFLDQDDLWMVNKLELQTRVMTEAGADIVFSNAFIFRDGIQFDETLTFPIISGRYCGQEMLDLLFIQNRIPILTVLVKKNLIEEIGFIDDDESIRNCDDYDLWLRLAERGATFFGMPDCLARYRVHQSQASKNKIQSLKSEAIVLEKHRRKVGIDEQVMRYRFCDIYQKLASSLVEENRVDEAKGYLYHQLSREGFKVFTMFQILVLKTAPSKYNQINSLLRRIHTSASYRIARPINNLRRMFSQ